MAVMMMMVVVMRTICEVRRSEVTLIQKVDSTRCVCVALVILKIAIKRYRFKRTEK